MDDNIYLREDIHHPTDASINFWMRNLSNVEKDIIRRMRIYVKNELIKYQIYVPTIIQPIEDKNSTAWGDYGWDEVAEDEDIPNDSHVVIFELKLIIQNDTINPFIKDGLFIQHNLPTMKSKIIVDRIFKKYFGLYYTWDMTDQRSIKLQTP
jgi:hypothetical protein